MLAISQTTFCDLLQTHHYNNVLHANMPAPLSAIPQQYQLATTFYTKAPAICHPYDRQMAQ